MIFRHVALLFGMSYSWRVGRLSRQALPQCCVYAAVYIQYIVRQLHCKPLQRARLSATYFDFRWWLILRCLSSSNCNRARIAAGKPRASRRSLRTTASFSQSVPGVGVMCSSSALHGWFALHSCLLPCVDRRARLSDSSPRSRCKVSLDDNFQGCGSTPSGSSLRHGCQWRRKQLSGECVGTAQPRSTACSSADTRTTTVHPTPKPLLGPRREPVFASEVSSLQLFLSQRVRVLRETPKMRLIPRREARSW